MCQDSFQILFQRRDVRLDNGPDLIWIDGKIVMDENIAESDNLAPRDLGIFPLRLFRHTPGRFSEYLKMMNNPYLDQFIIKKNLFAPQRIFFNIRIASAISWSRRRSSLIGEPLP